MKLCIACDEPLPGPEAFRIRIGGVIYDENHGAQFVQEECDVFRDGSTTKWLCRSCAVEHDVYISELEFDSCQAVDGRTPCNQTFEPSFTAQSECVLLVEWGSLDFTGKSNPFVTAKKEPDLRCPRCRGRGRAGREECRCVEVAGHIHYNCACDSWRLPLYDIPPKEAP